MNGSFNYIYFLSSYYIISILEWQLHSLMASLSILLITNRIGQVYSCLVGLLVILLCCNANLDNGIVNITHYSLTLYNMFCVCVWMRKVIVNYLNDILNFIVSHEVQKSGFRTCLSSRKVSIVIMSGPFHLR